MRREGMIGLAALAVAIGFATSSVALDSTSRQRIDSFGWQAPNARMLNNKTEDQLDVNSAASANTASYATNAGMLGGAPASGLSVGYAASAGTADTAGSADTAINADYADVAGNGVQGVETSTRKLTLTDGTVIDLPSGGGGSSVDHYDGCTAYLSDGSTRYACTTTGGTSTADWTFVSKQTYFYSACGTNPPGRVDGTYRTTRTTTREDTVVILQETVTKSATCATFDSDGGYLYCNGVPHPGCPGTPQSSWVSTWRAELGW